MSAMHLYTVVVDYKGGTYLAQLRARSRAHAMREWVRRIQKDEEIVRQFTLRALRRLETVDWKIEERPVNVAGLVNVWCATALVRNELCLFTLVLTRTNED